VSTTHQLIAQRSKLLASNVALNYSKAPIHIVRGRAQFLYDDAGHEYLDAVNNVCHVGHCHPDVVQALCSQLASLNTNSRYLHTTLLEASAKLTATLPGDLAHGCVFWVNSGSEANDLALRLARAHTRKRGVLVVDGAYHGHVSTMIDASPYKFDRTGGTGLRCARHTPYLPPRPDNLALSWLSMPRSYVRTALIPDVFSGVHRGNLDDDAMGAAYAADVERQLESFKRQERRDERRQQQLRARQQQLHADMASATTAAEQAVLMDELEDIALQLDDDGCTSGCGIFYCESILSCGGQVVPPAGYFRRVYAAVRAAGGVCVADEVQVGFGRVGSHMWAFQLQGDDVVPDIVTMGKPIGDGYPVALVVTTPAVAASFGATGMEYFNTFGGNPPAAAAALATLNVLEREQLQAKAVATGAILREGFLQLSSKHSCIGSVRGLGLMQGLEILHPDTVLSGERKPWSEAAYAIVYAMRLQARILLSVDGMHNNVIKLKPPMVFNADDAHRLLAQLGTVMEDLPGALEAYHKLG